MRKLRHVLRPWKWIGDQLHLQQQVRTHYPKGTKLGTFRYGQFKEQALRAAVEDESILSRFREDLPLPAGFGWGIDERIVEYPWVFSRVGRGSKTLLDAGSTFNYRWIADLPTVREKTVVLYTLAPEGTLSAANYSYIYGDLRQTILRDSVFDVIVCISTLEHVGMDNTWFYTADRQFGLSQEDTFQEAVREFRRMLLPGGRLLLTVPFGKPQRLGWLRQFDISGLAEIQRAFGEAQHTLSIYRYAGEGWQRSTAEESSECEYLFVPLAGDPTRGGAASATAVACLELVA